jgi:hypothetical protein
VTAEYRHFRSGGHHIFGERPDARADFLEVKARVIDKHCRRHTPAAIARVIDRLRAETVAAVQAVADRTAELEAEHHRHAGERAALVQELDRHRAATAEHHDLTSRLYAEIERLNALVSAMESTKAWRLHRAFEKLRRR